FPELIGSDEASVQLGHPSKYAAMLSGVIEDFRDWSHPRLRNAQGMTSSARTIHKETSVRRFASTTPGTTEPVSRFLRLHPDEVCNTLRAGTASDRGAHTSPRPIHPWHDRVLTVREAARLHSYPDWFRFHVTKWHGFRQIGNSVPPLLARAVGSSLLEADGVVPQRGSPLKLGDPALLGMNASEAERHFGLASRVIPQRRRMPTSGV